MHVWTHTNGWQCSDVNSLLSDDKGQPLLSVSRHLGGYHTKLYFESHRFPMLICLWTLDTIYLSLVQPSRLLILQDIRLQFLLFYLAFLSITACSALKSLSELLKVWLLAGLRWDDLRFAVRWKGLTLFSDDIFHCFRVAGSSKLRPWLLENLRYIVVPEDAWNNLLQWYSLAEGQVSSVAVCFQNSAMALY